MQLLGCILIARGTKMGQNQRQIFLELANIIFPSPHWQCTHWHLRGDPGLGEAKVQPDLCPLTSYNAVVTKPQPLPLLSRWGKWWPYGVCPAMAWVITDCSSPWKHAVASRVWPTLCGGAKKEKSLKGFTSHSQHPEPSVKMPRGQLAHEPRSLWINLCFLTEERIQDL